MTDPLSSQEVQATWLCSLLEDIKVATASLQDKVAGVVTEVRSVIDKEIEDAHVQATQAHNVLSREARIYHLHSFCMHSEVDPTIFALRNDIEKLKTLLDEHLQGIFHKLRVLLEIQQTIRSLEWRQEKS